MGNICLHQSKNYIITNREINVRLLKIQSNNIEILNCNPSPNNDENDTAEKEKETEDKNQKKINIIKENEEEKNIIEKENNILKENNIKLEKENKSLKRSIHELDSYNKKEIENIIKKNEKNIKDMIKETENKIHEEYEKKIDNIIKQKNEELIKGYEDKEKNMNNIIKEKNLELKKLKDQLIELKEPVLVGLNNIGATCYMNSSLQCLSNTKELTDYFLKNYKINQNRIMANEYHNVILNLWKRENNNKSYSPNSFKEVLSKENPLFDGIAANDSKDLINFLLERFHKELNEINTNITINNINENNNNYNIQQDQTNELFMLTEFLKELKKSYNSVISHLFYGVIETKSQCVECNTLKFNFQIYSFLEFPLEQVNLYCFNLRRRTLLNKDGTNPDVDLYECFEYYEKVDLMTGDNQMYCNKCKKMCNAYYSTTIYSGPKYLIIHLNRGKGAIYECNVNFYERLNLLNFINYKNGITVFELYAVICHIGPSSMSGHFVAYCKNRIDNKWYLYNDAFVSLCTRNYQYREGMPYILFYKYI